MNTAVKFFTDYMEKKNVRYTILRDDLVQVSFKGKNMPQIEVRFCFGDDGRDVSAHVFSIAKVPDEKVGNACFACSNLNDKWRWVKFYLDSDNEVTAGLDAVIDPYTTGEECFELLIRMCDIVDEAYPDIMKMLWS
ncbi:YbjN domain-containing protein [uncultured Oscillibacter sp.]|uniref:YbjN domain-containing protein n=1 Tax=uncultured Oscillibacter sp. TaxID=876091 RepID=UPI002616E55A|nr:YbjN domain-containing protein [uncultured Oscillibacter sp.]